MKNNFAILFLAAMLACGGCGEKPQDQSAEAEKEVVEAPSEEEAKEKDQTKDPSEEEARERDQTSFKVSAGAVTDAIIEMGHIEPGVLEAAVREALDQSPEESEADEAGESLEEASESEENSEESQTPSQESSAQIAATEAGSRILAFDPGWKYAGNSAIHSGTATLYTVPGAVHTVAVNAGHGTKGGSSVKTLCHPDGSAKVTGGSTAAGETKAIAVSGGTTMLNGTPEPVVTLSLARLVKDELLQAGYNVLMIRDGEDVQLDNIARTLMANNNSDVHIALHYDSSENDKGFFYISVPDVASYRSMEPVASNWQKHMALGEALLTGARARGLKIYGKGTMAIDLTQTSYSTIPSVDVEVGDRGSDTSAGSQKMLAEAIRMGMDTYFGR